MKIGDNVVLRGTIKGVTYGEYGFPHYLVTLPNGCETEFPKLYIENLQWLDEPEKVKVPPFVDDVITEWYQKKSNRDLFARAWLDGCEVEEEKWYVVKVKGNIKENMLVYGEFVERYFFTKSSSLYNVIYSHTRKELEEAGFGWVFDCPGIEIEEVE